MRWHIVLGTLGLVGLVGLLALIGIDEERRMANFNAAYDARRIEEGAAIFENNCLLCHGPQGRGTPLGPALNSADLFNGQRLQAVGFTGTVENYVQGTISAGRPVPSTGTSYSQRMPTWSQEFGGPLRPDQIEALTAFVLNWGDRALAEGAGPTPVAVEDAYGVDITQPLPEGDPENGRALSEGILGCASCHLLSPVGPSWEAGDEPGMGARAALRIEQENYSGSATSAEQYLIEAVVQANIHVVEGYSSGVMPATFGEQLNAQELADLVAYLMSFR